MVSYSYWITICKCHLQLLLSFLSYPFEWSFIKRDFLGYFFMISPDFRGSKSSVLGGWGSSGGSLEHLHNSSGSHLPSSVGGSSYNSHLVPPPPPLSPAPGHTSSASSTAVNNNNNRCDLWPGFFRLIGHNSEEILCLTQANFEATNCIQLTCGGFCRQKTS